MSGVYDHIISWAVKKKRKMWNLYLFASVCPLAVSAEGWKEHLIRSGCERHQMGLWDSQGDSLGELFNDRLNNWKQSDTKGLRRDTTSGPISNHLHLLLDRFGALHTWGPAPWLLMAGEGTCMHSGTTLSAGARNASDCKHGCMKASQKMISSITISWWKKKSKTKTKRVIISKCCMPESEMPSKRRGWRRKIPYLRPEGASRAQTTDPSFPSQPAARAGTCPGPLYTSVPKCR